MRRETLATTASKVELAAQRVAAGTAVEAVAQREEPQREEPQARLTEVSRVKRAAREVLPEAQGANLREAAEAGRRMQGRVVAVAVPRSASMQATAIA